VRNIIDQRLPHLRRVQETFKTLSGKCIFHLTDITVTAVKKMIFFCKNDLITNIKFSHTSKKSYITFLYLKLPQSPREKTNLSKFSGGKNHDGLFLVCQESGDSQCSLREFVPGRRNTLLVSAPEGAQSVPNMEVVGQVKGNDDDKYRLCWKTIFSPYYRMSLFQNGSPPVRVFW
jgi:hypothetical protein